MKIKIISILPVFVVLTSIAATNLYAYKTDTHESITEKTVALSARYQEFISEFKLGAHKLKALTVYGSFAEDSSGRFANHFYDPMNEKGLGPFLSAISWGYKSEGILNPDNKYSWTKAREYMYGALIGTSLEVRNTNFENLFRSLGQVIHLVQDMAQPSHTRDDPHSSHYESEAGAFLLNSSHLEDWAQFHQDQVADFINTASGPRSVDSFEDAFETLALFSNQNFFSDDTIFKNYALPSEEETNYTKDFLPYGIGEVAQIVAEDRQVYSVPYIIKTSGVYKGFKLAQVGYFGSVLVRSADVGKHLLAFQIDDEVAMENAQFLIPQAVGYSAGLLDYFFRGRIDMVKDPNTAGQYLIQNKSSEPMSGTYSLYYDDASDSRQLVANWSLSINPNSQSSPVTFTAPTSPQPKEKGKFILVFQGNLGSENGAVVGNVVKLETKNYVFIVQEICEMTGEPSPYISFSLPTSIYKSQTWYNSPQVAEGRFIIYGNVKEISLRMSAITGDPPAQQPLLYINGEVTTGGRWQKGDTPDLPSTWRIENLLARTPLSIAGGLATLTVMMEDDTLFTQPIAQYIGRPYQDALKSIRLNRIEILQQSYYAIYVPPSFNIVQLAGYSEAAQLNNQATVNIEFYYDDFNGTFPNFISLNASPAQPPFLHYIAGFAEQKVAYLPIPTNLSFLEFPFDYLPLTFNAEIQKTYSEVDLEEFKKAGIVPPHYSVVFK